MWKRISQNPRTAGLGGVLIGLLLTISIQYRPLESLSQSGFETRVMYEAHEVPILRSPWMDSTARDDKVGLRDPFSFPSTQLGEQKAPQILQPNSGQRSPTQNGANDRLKDQHRAITHEYLGYVGPFRRPFAVFRYDGEVTIASKGQVLDGGYVLRSFDEEAAVFTHTVDGRRRRVSVEVSER